LTSPTRHVAIVTGANHGIGAAVARRLAADGAAVVVAYLRTPVAADPGTPEQYNANRMRDGDEVVSAIRAAGGEAVGIECDLTDPTAATGLFDLAEASFGPVDILINNATGWTAGDSFVSGALDPIGRTTAVVTAELFERTFGVDARAAALLIAEFAARLLRRGGNWGRIVGFTSGGPDGFPSEVTYGAAKAAQENYTKAAATELGRHGVTANIIHPPITDSGWVTDEVRALASTSRDHFHVAEPDEVAEVLSWLCSDAARYVTGNVIRMR
jgi:3-oxoacyl-[acyl-carrier protein] reductase